MQNFHIKNIVLGVGIGIVITSATGFLYSSSVSTKVEMTKEEIIKEAEKYGMVKSSQVFITSSPTPGIEATVAPTAAPTATPSPDPTPTPTPVPVIEVTITVNSGDTAVMVADKLIEAKVITDRDAFVTEMINSGAAYNIIARSYNLQQGMQISEVIKALTAKKVF